MTVALLAAGCSSSSHSPTRATSSSAVPAAAKIDHVAIIVLENKSYDETFGPASQIPYLQNVLVPKGELLENYYAIGHVSLDNYVAMISGQPPNPQTQRDCIPTFADFAATGTGPYGVLKGQGCVYPTSVPTVANQLQDTRLTWKGYMEDMGNGGPGVPTTCRHPQVGQPDPNVVARPGDQYVTRHNPFVYFHSIIDTPSCAANDVPFDRLPQDLAAASTTPNLAFITPNLCHDGHDSPCVDGEPGGNASINQWLQQWIPRLLAAPAYRTNGMIVITFDEAEIAGNDKDAGACCDTPPDPNTASPGLFGPGGGRIGTLVLSSAVKPGTVNPRPYNHYSLLCSVENVFGLPHLGFAANPGLPCFGRDVYNR